jgi:hypothetical protein
MADLSEQKTDEKPVQNERKPNETTGLYFSSGIKITDPDTGEVLIQMRAD